MNSKVCKICNEEKSANEFAKHSLKKGKQYTRNCCKACDAKRMSEFQKTPRGRYVSSKTRAKYRDIEFNLSLTEYSNIVSKPCAYCASPLNPFGIGIDRLDSSKGYILGNCVPCCRVCNVIKMELTTEELHAHLSFMLLNLEAMRARLSSNDTSSSKS